MPWLRVLFVSLAAWVGPLAVRVLVGLGFSAVVYVGLDAAFSALASSIRAQFGGFGEYAGLVGLTGVDDAVEIVLAAWLGRIAIIQTTKTLKIVAGQ